jgi:hypothetical protein
MRHKFLICIESGDFLLDEVDPGVREHIHTTDDVVMFVIECFHPNFDDNVVDINGYNLVRDVNGKLYLYLNYFSKANLISMLD